MSNLDKRVSLLKDDSDACKTLEIRLETDFNGSDPVLPPPPPPPPFTVTTLASRHHPMTLLPIITQAGFPPPPLGLCITPPTPPDMPLSPYTPSISPTSSASPSIPPRIAHTHLHPHAPPRPSHPTTSTHTQPHSHAGAPTYSPPCALTPPSCAPTLSSPSLLGDGTTCIVFVLAHCDPLPCTPSPSPSPTLTLARLCPGPGLLTHILIKWGQWSDNTMYVIARIVPLFLSPSPSPSLRGYPVGARPSPSLPHTISEPIRAHHATPGPLWHKHVCVCTHIHQCVMFFSFSFLICTGYRVFVCMYHQIHDLVNIPCGM
jgi:hypothetical protein